MAFTLQRLLTRNPVSVSLTRKEASSLITNIIPTRTMTVHAQEGQRNGQTND